MEQQQIQKQLSYKGTYHTKIDSTRHSHKNKKFKLLYNLLVDFKTLGTSADYKDPINEIMIPIQELVCEMDIKKLPEGVACLHWKSIETNCCLEKLCNQYLHINIIFIKCRLYLV